MFAAHQTTGDKTRKTPQKTRKKPAKTRKNTQKHAKTRKSWNLVVLGSFRIFLVVPKIITVCVPGRSAEIFPETYMFGTKWIIFWFVWPIFLERPFFPRQWRVEDIKIIIHKIYIYILQSVVIEVIRKSWHTHSAFLRLRSGWPRVMYNGPRIRFVSRCLRDINGKFPSKYLDELGTVIPS